MCRTAAEPEAAANTAAEVLRGQVGELDRFRQAASGERYAAGDLRPGDDIVV